MKKKLKNHFSKFGLKIFVFEILKKMTIPPEGYEKILK
jgi:hypothetical protein